MLGMNSDCFKHISFTEYRHFSLCLLILSSNKNDEDKIFPNIKSINDPQLQWN